MQGYYENHRDDMSDAVAWYTRNDQFTPHFHNSIELMYVVEGTLLATLDGEEHTVGADTMAICSSYTIHSYETPASSYSIVAIIPMSAVPSARQLLHKRAFARPMCPDDERRTLRGLMAMMTQNAENPLVMKGLCYTLLGLIIKRVGLVETRSNARTAFIREVMDYLQAHHAEPLCADGVASYFGYSRSRFSHLFNSHLGCSLSEFLRAVRCQHAAQLLKETDMAVSDVAMAVGFESLRTFFRSFKNQYEMTPSRYAKSKSTQE